MIALVSSLLLCAGPPGGQGSLARAVAAFDDGEDAAAFQALTQVLASAPGRGDAAKAHLYLGLVWLNDLHVDECQEEFRKALALDPILELPPHAAPKARLLFKQVVAELAAAPDARRDGLTAEARATRRPNLLPGLTVAGGGIAALATGVAFGVAQGAAVSSANGARTAASASAFAQQARTDGIVADACFIGGAALGITGVILMLALQSKGDSLSLVPVASARGGALALGGVF